MNRLLRAGFAAGFLLAFQAAPAKANTIYNNGTADGDLGDCAEDSGWCDGTWTVFDDFVVSSATTLTDVFWTSTFELSDFNGIRAWIYDKDPVDAGGTVQHTLHTLGTQGTPTANGVFFDVQLTGLSISLAPGIYWLGMQHDTDLGPGTVACVSGGCGFSGNSTQWQDDGAGFRIINGREYAFRLESNIAAVPDSGTLAPLVGLVWAAMFVWRRQL